MKKFQKISEFICVKNSERRCKCIFRIISKYFLKNVPIRIKIMRKIFTRVINKNKQEGKFLFQQCL